MLVCLKSSNIERIDCRSALHLIPVDAKCCSGSFIL